MGIVEKGFYYVSSAPTIVRGRIVLGGWVSDNQSTDEPSGVIRAYDAASGRFAWAWDMGRPGENREPAPGRHYTRSPPHRWATQTPGEVTGRASAPTGGSAPDPRGGHRRHAADRQGRRPV